MNLLQARTQVRNDISQPVASTSDFTDSELNGFIGISMRHLGALVKKPTKRFTPFQVTVNTNIYSIATYASDLVIPTVAYFGDASINGDIRKLRIIPEEELSELAPSWLQTAQNQLGRPSMLIRDGANLILNPTPSAAESTTGKMVYISGVYAPVDPSSDTVALDIPLVYHDLAVRLATAFCYLDSKLNNPTLGNDKKNQVESDAKKFSSLIIKESESPGFYWGNFVDNGEDDFNGLRFY